MLRMHMRVDIKSIAASPHSCGHCLVAAREILMVNFEIAGSVIIFEDCF